MKGTTEIPSPPPDHLARLVAQAPMPILLVELRADGELHITPNQLARHLSGDEPPWYPLGHVENWEEVVARLEEGESDTLMIVVDDLDEYGRRWNLERNRTSWSVVFSRLGTTTWSVFAHDITGQYRYVEMLEDTLASRERAFELLAQVAHELKQPVTSISGLSQVVLERETNTETAELVGLIGSESASMIALIDDLLTSGLVSSDRLRVQTEAAPAGTVIEELQRVASAFVERDVAVRFEGDRDVAVFVDKRRLTQVVRGIIQNAVKYGGPHIELVATTETDRFVLEVSDDGPGVPAAEVDLIFQPFSAGQAGQRMGTGIGLAVARSIVADMGGLLEYRPGDPGAVFVLTLHVESDSLLSAPLDAARERPALMAELIEYERDSARLRLNRLAFRHRATEVIEEIVRPVMYDVGDQWARGDVSVSQEHHASSVVQSWLMDAMARFRPWRRHTVVCVSGPGSHHEIGTASVAVALAEAGYRVIYLGRGVPVEDLVNTIDVSHASALMVSVTLPEQLDGIRHIADALSEQVGAGLILGVGGHLFSRGVPTEDLPALYMGHTSQEAVASLGALLETQTVR